jgi:hypothetical protein
LTSQERRPPISVPEIPPDGQGDGKVEQYNAVLINRARRELEEASDSAIVALGRFSVSDPNAFRAFATLTLGAAALGGFSAVTGEAIQRSLDFLAGPEEPRPEMPHRVLVVVTPDAVTAFGPVHRQSVGTQAARWEAGGFDARIARLPFEIDLTIEVNRKGRVVLVGKRGWRSGASATARAVMKLATADALR